MEDNDIYIFDLNFIYTAYLGIYFFAFEVREVYLLLTLDFQDDFYRLKSLNRKYLLIICSIMCLTLFGRDLIFIVQNAEQTTSTDNYLIIILKFIAFITDMIVFGMLFKYIPFLFKKKIQFDRLNSVDRTTNYTFVQVFYILAMSCILGLNLLDIIFKFLISFLDVLNLDLYLRVAYGYIWSTLI